MHIIITSVHMDMTDAIRGYAFEKMRSLEKYVPEGDTSAKLSVELSRTNNHHAHGEVYKAEGILHIRGKETTVRTTQDDLYKAIDVLKDMLARELAQHKDKERSIFRRSAHKMKQLLKRIID